MPILAAGSNAGAQRGLTLVELLIVLIVLATLSGFALLSLPEGGTDEAEAARTLERMVAQLEDSAVMTGRMTGLSLENSRFQPWVFRDGDWQRSPHATGAALLPPGVDATLSPAVEMALPAPPGEDQTLDLSLAFGATTQEEGVAMPAPPVTFSPTAEVTPFAARLVGELEVWTLTVDASGERELARDEG